MRLTHIIVSILAIDLSLNVTLTLLMLNEILPQYLANNFYEEVNILSRMLRGNNKMNIIC